MELDSNAEHTRGLTMEICRTKIAELDAKLAAGRGGDAQIYRWQQSREFFQRHLRWLRRQAWRENEL